MMSILRRFEVSLVVLNTPIIIVFIFFFSSCNEKRADAIKVKGVGIFLRDSSMNLNISETNEYVNYEDSVSIPPGYTLKYLDRFAPKEVLLKYSTPKEILSELLARGKFSWRKVIGDTTIPLIRPSRNKKYTNVTTDSLDVVEQYYQFKAIVNDRTYKIDDPEVGINVRKQGYKIFALIASKYFPSIDRRREKFTITPTSRDNVIGRYSICDNSKMWKYTASCSIALGTAIPIGKDVMLTAGHCFDKKELKDIVAVLGYYDTTQKNSFQFSPEDIFYPVAIIDSALEEDNDYAFVKLNRALPNKLILPLKKNANYSNNQDCYLLSYPMGIPLRVSFGNIIGNSQEPSHIEVKMDSFRGCSGGALFDANDSLMGMLYKGTLEVVLQDGPTICCRYNFCEISQDCSANIETIDELLKRPKIKKYLSNNQLR